MDDIQQTMQAIGTDRLLLRHWREDDAEALFKYASDPRVSELAMWPCHTSVEMSREVIREVFMPNPYSYAMILKETGEAIGCMGLVPAGSEHYKPLEGEMEVGYWVGHPYWNKGLTSEALNGFIGYCRDVLHLGSLLITTDDSNKASQRVAVKCGFSPIATYDYGSTPSRAFRLPLGV
ncbi:MAG: GNAT family N-acetyltransferase [Bacteroides sp.]|nr:GNAT family N-acetyltransferase [Bacteroides sp.]